MDPPSSTLMPRVTMVELVESRDLLRASITFAGHNEDK